MIDQKLILITLLVKLGVAASVSSALARSRTFQRLLFADHRQNRQTMALMAFLLVPLTLGVWVRLTVRNFLAADLSFETVTLLGLLVGPAWGMLSGLVLAFPATIRGEYLAPPFLCAVGLVSGLFGAWVEKEEIWSFTPFVDLSVYRWVRRNLRKPKFDRQILLLMLIAGMEVAHDWLSSRYPHRLFALDADALWLQVLVWLCAPMVVAISLKMWNALRIELKLEEQKRLVLEARLDALQRQINPHFLFNTLNSIGSLVRFRPDLAREMIIKLANLLRALLKDHDTYVPLRDELSFTDDYLDIEVVRFGSEKLKVVKELDPKTLDVLVPSILLQPLIENSIKHGLEPRIQGGTITLRSRMQGDSMVVEVEDDGVGIVLKPPSALARGGAGIGMKNVRERLEVLYGNRARFTVVSRPGRGTLVSIEIPSDLPEMGR
ncbi:sensor histidine kinase [Acidicapsa ligni]|uniref:sensor histidine kinase n=1 Tax=Acidicapsa ligni TaxID=542300 RepID=UPI0021E03FD0|nr:histidine kinase [Acidicapsa ligni]